MNKKVQKGLVAAVAATMGASVVAPVVQAATVDLATQYAQAYAAYEKAAKSKDQKDLTEARALLDALYVRVKGTKEEYLATTLTSLLDPVQQSKFEFIIAVTKTKVEEVEQKNINEGKYNFNNLSKTWQKWFESYSSALDTVQQGYYEHVLNLVKNAKTQAELDAAKVKFADLMTMNHSDEVKKVYESTTQAEIVKTQAAIDKAAEEAAMPKVESVTAINGKQVEVKFSGNIDVTTLTKTTFTVTQEGDAAGADRLTNALSSTNIVGGATAGTGIVKADKATKTVVLTMDMGAKFTNGKEVTVTVSGLKHGDAVVNPITVKSVLKDTTAPTVVGATSVGSNKIKVTFSEAIYNGTNDDYTTDIKTNNFTINNGAVAIASAIKDSSDANSIIITTSSNLVAGNEYSVKVNPASSGAICDYTGYKVIEGTTVKLTHAVETNAPTVTAEALGEYTVALVFDKAVNIPANANIEFRYGYNATGAIKVSAANTTNVQVYPNTGRTVWLVSFDTPMNIGEGTVYVNYTNAANSTKTNVITDDYGNVLANGTAVKFNVENDTTAPTVKVSYKNPTSIDVQFSESVSGQFNANNYVVRDKNGNQVAINSISTVSSVNNIYRLNLASSMAAGGNWTVEVSDEIKDTSINENRLAKATYTVTAPDTLQPTITGVMAGLNSDKIHVYFTEDMSANAIDLANYRLATTAGAQYALPAGTTITQNGATVTINLPKPLNAIATDLGLGSGTLTRLFVGAVSDLAGNQLSSMTNNPITAYSANFTATVTEEKLLSDSQVSFKVDRHLKAVNATSIAKVSGTAATSATFVNNADGTATVTANFAANTFNTSLSGQAISVSASALTDLNDFTNSLLSSEALAVDYASAKIVGAVAKDTDTVANGKIDTIEVSYSEGIYAGSVSESDYVVEGYTVTEVLVGGSTVTLKVAEKANMDYTVSPKVTQVGMVEDAITITTAQPARNVTGAQDPIYATAVTTSAAALGITATVNRTQGAEGTPGVNEKVDLVITGTATATGRIAMNVGGTIYFVNITSGETATAIATKIEAAITTAPTGYNKAVATNTVTFTSTTPATDVADLSVVVY